MTVQTSAEIVTSAMGAHEIVDWLTDCRCGWSPPKNLGTSGTWEALTAHRAAMVVDALAGRLLPDGGETREEWSTEPSLHPRRYVTTDAALPDIVCTVPDAQRAMRDYARGIRNGAKIVRRIVRIGPWEPVRSEP